ncbi:MAG: chorismate-binding protein [Thermodesulfobacteriota bacterium]|nr:MAG: anthranilate synthase component I family protein [Candidatus Dadabacteria bacterium]
MTTHLKSRNGSWKLNNKSKNNLIFDELEAFIYKDKNDKVFLVKNGTTRQIKKGLVPTIQAELKKGHYACGYFSFEYNNKVARKKDYKAIFNIYKKASIDNPKKTNNINTKTKFKKSSDIHFKNGIKKVKKYIEEGDIYQINLTREFVFDSPNNPYSLFQDYYKFQPVEYAGFFKFHDHILISGSMELFVQKIGNKITTAPIKGTAKPGTEQDRNLNKNKKETAENLMIVDLMRNDLSRICLPGSVKTQNLFKKKKYSTVTQLESKISGVLKNNVSNEDIFDNLMPPGSVTGTPKSRAIQIIKEIEDHERGPYCGAIGIFEPSGDFCFSVGIRVAIIEKNKSRFYTGAGIVWDSKPNNENSETILKFQAFKGAANL